MEPTPRITSITIENFKGISKSVTLPLKPITLLFGKNSAGKSTILQAMLYALEVIRTGNADIDKVHLGGESVNFGGFHNLVHKHDTTRAIRLRFDLQLDKWGLEAYPIHEEYNLLDELESDALGLLESISVELELSLFAGIPAITRYRIGSRGMTIASVEKMGAHGVFFATIAKTFKQAVINSEDDELCSRVEEIRQFFDSSADHAPDLENIQLLGQNSCIPPRGKPLLFEEDQCRTLNQIIDEQGDIIKIIDIFLSRILVRPAEYLYEHLSEIRYIGPIRDIPERNHNTPVLLNESRWSNGLAAWDTLFRYSKNEDDSTDNLINRVNIYLRDVLQLGYEIRREKSVAIDRNHKIFDLLDNLDEGQINLFQARYNQFREYMLSCPTHTRLFLFDLNKEVEVAPSDIGVGVSQVIPIVVGVLSMAATGKLPGILSVEQPELHIHPAVQCALGDLFIREKSSRRIFLIETHSEHLILRLLRRISETTDKELKDQTLALYPDELEVAYVNTVNDALTLTELPIDDDGEFTVRWPEGFFEERATELFGESDV